MRDVSRSSRNVVRVAMDAVASGGFGSPGETFTADGEIVWSWRRDPGVYPARLCGHGNGDNKGRSPGRVRISRKPLRGESRDVSAVPVKSVCVLHYPLHTLLRAQSAPAFPCALFTRDG